jgi:hypothetical protein
MNINDGHVHGFGRHRNSQGSASSVSRLLAAQTLLTSRRCGSISARLRSSFFHTERPLVNTEIWNIAMENGPFIDGLPIKNGDSHPAITSQPLVF